jgi:Ala-tRNA(Pro) deacylase
MDIAPTLVNELLRHGVDYDVINHDYAHSTLHAAHLAHIPASKMVKPVILQDDQGYVMALVTANQHVKINELNLFLNRKLGLAIEAELNFVFADCDRGAIPPVGDAYGMTTVVDFKLDGCDDVYFESGNHRDLLHTSGGDFRKLLENSRHASICVH